MPPIRFAGTLPLWFILTTSAAVFVLGIVSEYDGDGEEGISQPKDEERSSRRTTVSENASNNLRSGSGDRTEVSAQKLLGSYDLSRPLESRALAYSMISGLDASVLKELVTTISAHQEGKVREALLAVLVERWALLAPGAVVQLAVSGEADDAARVLMLKRGFLELARVAPTEARKFALLSKGDHRVDEVLEPMFAALAETDPELALTWLSDRELVPQKDLDQTSGEFFWKWAEIDPAAAADASLEHLSEWTVEAIAVNWASRDPRALARWAAKIESIELRGMALDPVVRGTVAHDGGALAMRLIGELFPDAAPRDVLSTLGQSLFRHDVDAGLAWFAGLSEAERLGISQTLSYPLVYHNPHRLVEFLDHIPDVASRRKEIERLSNTWGSRDVEAALNWANTLESDDRNAALMSLMRYRPELIAQIENPEELTRNQVMQFAGKVGALGMEVSQEWIDQLPTIEQRIAALGSSVRFWSDDPRGALEYLEAFDYGDGVHAQSARNSQRRNVVKSWGRSDPVAAVAWAEERGLHEVADEVRGAALVRMANSGEQEQAASDLLERLDGVAESADRSTSGLLYPVTRVARTWARRNPESAAEWVMEIPVEDIRNRAALQVASEWGDFAPEAALEWADGLEDAGMRDQALRGVFRAMAGRDLAAANEAITTVTLSDAERAGVLEEIAKIKEGGAQ